MKIVGTLRRMAAISMPGMILSQLVMQIMASNQCAATIVSTESAISSRLARLYFMPTWPMAIPSSTPMVWNMNGTPPAARTASRTTSPKTLQVHVAGDDVGVGVGDGDERLVPVVFATDDAGGAQQRPVRRALEAFLDHVGAHGARLGWILTHGNLLGNQNE